MTEWHPPLALEDESADGLATFVVAGRQRVHGTAPGGQLRLNPDDPQTRRLVTIGHLKPTQEGK